MRRRALIVSLSECVSTPSLMSGVVEITIRGLGVQAIKGPGPPSLGDRPSEGVTALLFVWNNSQTVLDRITGSVVAGNLLRLCFLGLRRYGTSQYYDFLVLERIDINGA